MNIELEQIFQNIHWIILVGYLAYLWAQRRRDIDEVKTQFNKHHQLISTLAESNNNLVAGHATKKYVDDAVEKLQQTIKRNDKSSFTIITNAISDFNTKLIQLEDNYNELKKRVDVTMTEIQVSSRFQSEDYNKVQDNYSKLKKSYDELLNIIECWDKKNQKHSNPNNHP